MVLSSVLVLFSIGFIAAVVLAVASRVLYVKEDPRIAAVEACMPGANCGGCGYPGCGAAAAAVVAGEVDAGVCIAGGAEIAENIAKVLGKKVGFKEPELAYLTCAGGNRAEKLYRYEGVQDCRAAFEFYEGDKKCGVGCLGLGACVHVCPFDALSMGRNGLPVVDPQKCRACRKCEEVCPTGVIRVGGLTNALLYLNKNTDCLVPCQQKCPLQIDMPDFLVKLRTGRTEEALMSLKLRNPMPMSIGRICSHSCETICRRNIVEQGVAIMSLERYLGDWEMRQGYHLPQPCNPKNGHKVAIIGGGPAGLSAAYYLRRIGYEPTIFDKNEKAGGMLRYGLGEYLLPEKIVDWEVEGILALGIAFQGGVQFGKDIDFDSLRESGFEAIFLATGAKFIDCSVIPGSGEKLSATDFLASVNHGLTTLSGKNVCVLGDSTTAFTAAISAVRLGAGLVAVLCEAQKLKMGAAKSEIRAAEELGVKIMPMTEVLNVEAKGGKQEVTIANLKLKDPKKPTAGTIRSEDEPQILQAELVIVASERKPELGGYEKNGEFVLEIDKKKGTIVVDPQTLQTSLGNVFAGGEVVSGESQLMNALADGRLAARSIWQYLSEGKISVPENLQSRILTETILKNMDMPPKLKRQFELKELSFDKKIHSFQEDVPEGLNDREAINEAMRCLRCGLTCYDSDAAAHLAFTSKEKSVA